MTKPNEIMPSSHRGHTLVTLIALLLCAAATALAQQHQPSSKVPPVVHPAMGTASAEQGAGISLKIVGQKHNFPQAHKENRDTDIWSPKSVHFHPNGTKYYINSLEGGLTLVYDARTNQKLKVIKHVWKAADAALWAEPSGLFPFTHYASLTATQRRTFFGRPVESAFSHGGRYLWVPYYRRSWDLNAQDPSAMAVIDTRTDQVVRLLETGPLPKMVACSHDGNTMAVAHWGDNTVGLIDISGQDPAQWRYKACVTVDYKLKLNYSLTEKVDRDTGSGYMLRGTVYTPDDRYLLLACMGGGGGIAVVDLRQNKYLGRLTGVTNARHLVMDDQWLYASLNVAGVVQRVGMAQVMQGIAALEQGQRTASLGGWQGCKVGGGARTISLSPNGRYVFAACNSVSRLSVVDTRTMKLVATLPIDSYPVGLDVSADGSMLVTTSQGRQGHGGNAVNLVQVTGDVAPEPQAAAPAAQQEQPEDQDTEASAAKGTVLPWHRHSPWMPLVALVCGIVIVLGVVRVIHWHDKRK